MKRKVSPGERLLAALAGFLLLPPGLLVALAILVTDGPPVFFIQERVGQGGGVFPLFKFRSMTRLPAGQFRNGLTVPADPQITWVGKWLRRSRMDEWPQLLNIIRGEMSWVGPRPELACYVAHYRPEERLVLESPPGLTDPASIVFRHEGRILARSADPEKTYIKHLMPRKIRMNLRYAAQRTPISDCCVVVATVRRLLCG